MKKQLNMKTLAKGMRVEDKAKLLFADRNKRAETSGKEGLLTPEEEKAIVQDAQELNQINELNRLSRLYNIASYIMLDIQTAYLHFRLAEGKVVAVLTGMIIAGEADDALSHAIHDLAFYGYTDKQLDEKKFQLEIDKNANKLREKYKRNGLSNYYNYFESSVEDESYFSIQNKVLGQPNAFFQKVFIQTIEEVKKFKRQVYQCKHIVSEAGIELLGEREKKIIDDFTNEINIFINLDGHLSLTKIYSDFSDKGLIKKSQQDESRFILAIKDMQKATALSDKEREEAEKEIEEVIRKNDH